MALFPTAADLDALADPELVERWNTLVALREQVLAEIEPLRKNKQIGSSLQAKVVALRDDRGAAAARAVREAAADAVHRLRGRAAAGADRRRGARARRCRA